MPTLSDPNNRPGLQRHGINEGMTTTATPESNARPDVAPVVRPEAPGGWTPSTWIGLAVAVFVGAAGAVGSLLTSGMTLTAAAVAGAALTGGSAGLAAFFGIKSSGTTTTNTKGPPTP